MPCERSIFRLWPPLFLAMPKRNRTTNDSNALRREFEMPYAELALFIVKLLGVPGPYTLALDRKLSATAHDCSRKSCAVAESLRIERCSFGKVALAHRKLTAVWIFIISRLRVYLRWVGAVWNYAKCIG